MTDAIAIKTAFLVVVDDNPEMRAALRFACTCAKSTGGRVALLRRLALANSTLGL